MPGRDTTREPSPRCVDRYRRGRFPTRSPCAVRCGARCGHSAARLVCYSAFSEREKGGLRDRVQRNGTRGHGVQRGAERWKWNRTSGPPNGTGRDGPAGLTLGQGCLPALTTCPRAEDNLPRSKHVLESTRTRRTCRESAGFFVCRELSRHSGCPYSFPRKCKSLPSHPDRERHSFPGSTLPSSVGSRPTHCVNGPRRPWPPPKQARQPVQLFRTRHSALTMLLRVQARRLSSTFQALCCTHNPS